MNLFKIILFFLFITNIYAQRVEITSDSMEAKNLKKEVHFIGNAKINKDNDWLNADRIIVYFDDNNQTNKYVASGSVTFEFKENKYQYKGHSDRVTYYPLKSLYILKGKAEVEDVINKRYLNGDQITLDMLTGNAKVNGTHKKPVKFIFDVESKK